MDLTVVFIVLFLLVAVLLVAKMIKRSRRNAYLRSRPGPIRRAGSNSYYPHHTGAVGAGDSWTDDGGSSSNNNDNSGSSWWGGGGDSGSSWGGGSDSGSSWGGGGDSGGGGGSY
jgi:hypothetical protein